MHGPVGRGGLPVDERGADATFGAPGGCVPGGVEDGEGNDTKDDRNNSVAHEYESGAAEESLLNEASLSYVFARSRAAVVRLVSSRVTRVFVRGERYSISGYANGFRLETLLLC